jgi:two-component system, sensor histidine kinase LadS
MAVLLASVIILMTMAASYLSITSIVFSGLPAAAQIAISVLMIIICSVILVSVMYKMVVKKANLTVENLKEELGWLNLIMNKSNDLILILDRNANIISCNKNLTKLLNYNESEIAGKPLRDILYDEYLDHSQMIQNKLIGIYSGSETEFICSCKKKNDSELFEISFRIIPVMSEGTVEKMLVIGRLHEGDFLTKNYLINESSTYIIDNNLSEIYLLCYRLTRNLENKIPKSSVFLAQIALQEVFMNAIEHGNLEISYEKKTEIKNSRENYWKAIKNETNPEFFRDRKIYVSYYFDSKKVEYKIRDEGKGFNWKELIKSPNGIVDENILKNQHGMGLQIAGRIFKLEYNEKGNEVILTKYFD